MAAAVALDSLSAAPVTKQAQQLLMQELDRMDALQVQHPLCC